MTLSCPPVITAYARKKNCMCSYRAYLVSRKLLLKLDLLLLSCFRALGEKCNSSLLPLHISSSLPVFWSGCRLTCWVQDWLFSLFPLTLLSFFRLSGVIQIAEIKPELFLCALLTMTDVAFIITSQTLAANRKNKSSPHGTV